MKILNYKFWLKYVITDQIIYLEQMYTTLLNHADNPC